MGDSAGSCSDSETITVDTRSAYAEDMPPPSNQAQGLQWRKRRRSQVSVDDTAGVAAATVRIKALKEQIEKKKKEQEYQILLRVEKELQEELADLGE